MANADAIHAQIGVFSKTFLDIDWELSSATSGPPRKRILKVTCGTLRVSGQRFKCHMNAMRAIDSMCSEAYLLNELARRALKLQIVGSHGQD